MCRYSDSAIALMVAEGDTLPVAAIAHPLALGRRRIAARWKHGLLVATRQSAKDAPPS